MLTKLQFESVMKNALGRWDMKIPDAAMDDWYLSLRYRTAYDIEQSARSHYRSHGDRKPTLAQIIGGLPPVQVDKDSNAPKEPSRFMMCMQQGVMAVGFFMPSPVGRTLADVEAYYGGGWLEYCDTDWPTMRATQRELQGTQKIAGDTVKYFMAKRRGEKAVCPFKSVMGVSINEIAGRQYEVQNL